ncbi:hypothetical protein CEXT_680281 [Caerostris extrusa]|uniref:Uncharacterized protein n=1 Tax=Caerostris extrusa TaxID=172846 RepID=A0AAV4XHI3_CAEEX|nr:hypothetical protein CEXT_680281 [Caerostris extrusa]
MQYNFAFYAIAFFKLDFLHDLTHRTLYPKSTETRGSQRMGKLHVMIGARFLLQELDQLLRMLVEDSEVLSFEHGAVEASREQLPWPLPQGNRHCKVQ